MSYKYSWNETDNYFYDATLTTSLLNHWIDDKQDSSGRDAHQYYLNFGRGSLYHWPSTSQRQENVTSHYETEGDEPMDPPPQNKIRDHYENFTAITGVDFTVTSGLTDAWGQRIVVPGNWALGDNTSMTNVTFDTATVDAVGSNAKLNDITFKGNGGSVCLGGTSSREEEYVVSHTDMGDVVGTHWVNYTIGGQSLNTMSAAEDFDTLVVLEGASATVDNVTVERKMRNLFIAGGSDSYYNVNSRLNGSGTTVTSVMVHGALSSAYVGNGAVLNSLTVGNYRAWGADSHASAFVSEDHWGTTSHMSAINMVVASGGTANNIYLGFGGSVTVLGPEDRVSSTWVDDSNGGHYEVTTAYASGSGGVLTNLQMATSGGLMLVDANEATSRAMWTEPYNYDWKASSAYNSGFIAGAPQSAYVRFDSNTSGRNITIGNGGELRINSGASVVGISMGGLTRQELFTYKNGSRHLWIGDRGAKLVVNGGYASDVKLDPVRQSFDYYSASHDYFWLYSSSLEREYYESHNSTYPSGALWSSSVLNSAANGGYRQYMSAMYNSSGGVYTNLGDDTPYTRQYVGGEVIVNGGQVLNISGFSYLQATATVDVTVSNNSSSWEARQWTHGHVSKASGAVSATMEVACGGHVSNVKIEGGRVIMTAGGYANARWHGQKIKQSNFNLVEDLDLRTAELIGSDHAAVIEFVGGDSGGWSQALNDSNYHTTAYVDYRYDAMDPGEIHSVTANSGLTVSANWNWSKQDFTYIGNGATTINGLGTVVLKDDHERCLSDSYYGKGPYLSSAFDTYYFGVVKGVYNEENGRLDNYTILDGTNGGFDWKGWLTVGSGGIVQNIGSAAPLKTGNDIASETWTPEYTRDECKVLTVVAGGLADNVTVKGAVSNFEHYESQYTENRAGLLVSSGGTATNVTVLEGGIAMAKGGTIDKVFVGAGGVLYLSGWAGAHQVGEMDSDYNVTLSGPQYLDTTVLNGVRLDSGGQLTNTLTWGFRAGHAPSVIANAGGGIMNGVTANGVAYVSGLDFAGNITLTNGQKAENVTVRGYKTITSRDEEGNPTAYTTTIAYMNVSSGGIVKGATVGEEGAIYVSEGANVSGLTASGGKLIFANSSGWSDYFAGTATVDGISVLAGGELVVNSKFGLTATNMQIGENAGLTFTLGDTASEDYTPTELNGTWSASWGGGSFYTDDGTMSGFGGQFGQEYKDLFYSSSYVSARLSMTIAKGGILTGADLRGYGSVRVTSGGKIFNTHLRGITANIGASGYASGLTATTESTGSAYDTNIYVYGSGAVADDTVLSGGFLGVENSAVVNSVTLMAPEGYNGPKGDTKKVGPAEMEITAGGRANNVVASAGVITMYDGSSKDSGTAAPTLSNADVHSAATLIVNADGVVLDGTLNLGGLVVTTATRYEYVEVEVTDPDTGETYPDWQRIEKNNAVANASTLTVNFDLTERMGDEEAVMIDNLANLQGAKLGTITVSADQDSGKYVLAGGAEAFEGILTVIEGTRNLGTISVGGYIQASEEVTYKLAKDNDNNLVFSVLTTDAAVTDIIATVDGEKLLKNRWTNKAVNIKVETNNYAKSIWYRIRKAIGTRGYDEWLELDNEAGLTISERCEVDFKAIDDNGKESKVVTYTVNYDDVPATIADIEYNKIGKTYLDSGDSCWVGFNVQDDTDDEPLVELSTDNGETWEEVMGWDAYHEFEVTDNGTYLVRTTDHAGNVSVTPLVIDFYNMPAVTVASPDGIAWEGRPDTAVVVALADETGGSVEFALAQNDTSISFYNMPGGEYDVQVTYAGGEKTDFHQATITQNAEYVPAVREATDDGVTDVFFAQSIGVWGEPYVARHMGIKDGWAGTLDTVELAGKNRLADVFVGGAEDANILLLTDDDNGDTLFVDDLVTELPGTLEAQQARIAQIKEIYAGAGDDVVDLTSQRFDYVGDGMTVKGGDGDDVIWANQGDNWLFGDRGNDSIIGAGGNDVIVGGAGNDTLHGGGGNDIFVFGGDWGNDTITQLSGGKVTLWFEEGSLFKWNSHTLTYTDGDNSVKVEGVSSFNITLKFGLLDGYAQYKNLLAAGAFDEFTSENIFENKARGTLASMQ